MRENSGAAKERGVCRKLFTSTFALSAMTFGGGYVIVSLMKKKFVDELGWLSEEEMLNFTAIAQSAPGPVAVNASILLGYRMAGAAGAAVAILGTVLPPMITLSVISLFYTAFRDSPLVGAVLKGMRAGVAAVIADVVIGLTANLAKERDLLSVLLAGASFLALWLLDVNILLVLGVCAGVGAVRALWFAAKKKKEGEL